jgi:hypothetical protein
MNEVPIDNNREKVGSVYRAESHRVFATLIRLLGDFDLAEEALHDAFRAALEQWPRDGEPANPRGMAGIGRSFQGDLNRIYLRAFGKYRYRVSCQVERITVPADKGCPSAFPKRAEHSINTQDFGVSSGNQFHGLLF